MNVRYSPSMKMRVPAGCDWACAPGIIPRAMLIKGDANFKQEQQKT